MNKVTQQVTGEQPKALKLTRVIHVTLWSFGLCIGCFTASIVGLMHFEQLSFSISHDPDWKSFFLLDFLLDNLGWWITKTGHFVGFAVEEILLYRAFGRRNVAVLGCILFATTTELVQIPLGRDGRLYDIFIDISGVFLVSWYQSKDYFRRLW